MSQILLNEVSKNEQAFQDIHNDSRWYGSSQVAAIAGVNPYWSPLQEWCCRTGKLPRPDLSKNRKVRFGRDAQPILAKYAQEDLGGRIIEPDCILVHDKYEWAMSSPDCWREKDGTRRDTVEIKTSNIRHKDEWEDGAPDIYQVQGQWQVGIDDLSDGFWLYAMIGGDADNIKSVYFPRDEQIFSQLVEQVEKFRELVAKDIPPNAGPGDKDAINALYNTTEDTVELDQAKADEWVNRYIQLEDAIKNAKLPIKELEDEQKACQNNLRILMGAATKARVGAWLLSVKKTFIREAKPREYERVSFAIKGA